MKKILPTVRLNPVVIVPLAHNSNHKSWFAQRPRVGQLLDIKI